MPCHVPDTCSEPKQHLARHPHLKPNPAPSGATSSLTGPGEQHYWIQELELGKEFSKGTVSTPSIWLHDMVLPSGGGILKRANENTVLLINEKKNQLSSAHTKVKPKLRKAFFIYRANRQFGKQSSERRTQRGQLK